MNTQDPAQSADLSPADQRVQPDSPLSGEVKRGGELAGVLCRGEPLVADNVPALREGDILRHAHDGQFVFSGRVKLSAGPARLEVRALGAPMAGWRMIPFPAFTFHARPNAEGAALAQKP